jgi:hypothetical protein
LTGTFDSKYAEGWDGFRYRIVPIEIKPRSRIRTGKPLGAVETLDASGGSVFLNFPGAAVLE